MSTTDIQATTIEEKKNENITQLEEEEVVTTTIDEISSVSRVNEDVYQYFDDSCYQFMFADELRDDNNTRIRDISIFDRMLSVCVIGLQISIYIYLCIQTAGDVFADKIPVEIKFNTCLDVNDIPSFNITDHLTCDPGSENVVPEMAAIVVLSCFIIPDIAGAIKLLQFKDYKTRFTGILILAEGFLAMVAGAFFANVGNLTSGVDSFLGCVGVVFIHDIDEKIRDFYKIYPHFGYVLLFIVPLAVVSGAMILMMDAI